MTKILVPRGLIFPADLIHGVMAGTVAVFSQVMKPQPEGYPPFYLLPAQFGYGLFARDGEHKGSGLGYFYPPFLHLYGAETFAKHGGLAWQKNHEEHEELTCPYSVGEQRYVKEAWATNVKANEIYYRADKIDFPLAHGPWRSPMMMPRRYARTWIEITSVRLAQCQDITREEIIASGIQFQNGAGLGHNGFYFSPGGPFFSTASCAYANLWMRLNAKRGFPWSLNPWVWRVTLKLCEAPK